MGLIVLDTSVLIYARGGEHPHEPPCRRLKMAIGEGMVPATTTTGVLQEFAHVWSRRRSRSDAVRLADDYARMLSPLLPVNADDLRAGLTLFERHRRLGSFDAVLAGACLNGSVDALVSADRAFASVHGLRHVIPDAAGVASLLEP